MYPPSFAIGGVIMFRNPGYTIHRANTNLHYYQLNYLSWKTIKGDDFLQQTLIFNPISLQHNVVDLQSLKLLILFDKKYYFETSKVNTIRLQRYRDSKIRVCGKYSIPLWSKTLYIIEILRLYLYFFIDVRKIVIIY